MTQVETVTAGAGADTVVNQNFRALSPSGLYGIRQPGTFGLTLGYYGGAFNGVDVADGTVTLTASATNYVVAHRTTGAVTAATSTTNWLDTTTYMQLYQLVAGASTFTIAATSDKRQSFGGATGGSGGAMSNPMTTAGDLIYGGTPSSGVAPPTRLAATTNGYVLTLAAGVPTWAAATGGFSNPMTTSGDLILGGALGAPGRLGIGGNGQVLTVTGGVVGWAASASGFANPMTTVGDLIVGGASGAAGRLAAGAATYVLTSNGAGVAPTWQAPSGGGGLTNWTESVTTASPNATIPAVRFIVNNAAANVDAVVSPKGTGAFLLQLPDGLTSGGNKRGTNAIDLQMSRASAGAGGVASGDRSVLIGGANNTNSGNESFIGGGSGIFVNAAVQAGAVGGVSNTITGQGAFVGGGGNHTVSGINSAIIGGEYGTTRGTRASVVQSSFRNAFTGDLQCARLVVAFVTSDATPTSLSATGGPTSATNTPILPNASAFGFTATVTARSNTAGDTARYRIEGLIKRGANAASTAIVGTPVVTTIAADAGASAWAVAAIANTTLGGLEIQVTGAASTTVKWACILETVEVVGT